MNISSSSAQSVAWPGRTNFSAQAEQLRQYADAYAGSVGSFSIPVFPRYPTSFASPATWSPGAYPSAQVRTGGFEAFNAMSDGERERFLKDYDESNRAAEQRRDSILAEREQIFQQQQADFRSRWNSYSQTLQEGLKPPEEETGTSLSFIR